MPGTLVNLVANQDEVYLPTMGRLPSGLWYELEPVIGAPLELHAVCEAIRNRLEAGNPPVDGSARPSMSVKDSALLRATKSRSWKQMASRWATYLLYLTDEEVQLDISYRDKQGRWQYDGKKARRFPLDTPLETIVAVILADVHEQMEALAAL